MSKLIPKFTGKIEKNKLIFYNPQLFSLYLGNLEGKEVEIIVQKKVKSRNDKMNRYYWAFLHIIAKETGDDDNSLHEYFKRVLLPPQILEVLGKEIKIPASTSKLKSDEFSEYIDKIVALTGIQAPDTNDYYLTK